MESEDITLIFYSSDQELNRNELWSVDTQSIDWLINIRLFDVNVLNIQTLF